MRRNAEGVDKVTIWSSVPSTWKEGKKEREKRKKPLLYLLLSTSLEALHYVSLSVVGIMKI